MYNITGDKSYLDLAQKIATAAITKLSPNNTLQEPCEPTNNCDSDQTQFKGIFMRNLSYLSLVLPDPLFLSFITHNSMEIWTKDRSDTALGLKWGGPFDTEDASRQSSALDALIAAIPQQ